MSTDYPAFPDSFEPPPPRPKFQHQYGRHIVLFLLTLVTMSFATAFLFLWSAIGTDVNPFAAFTLDVFLDGLWYAIPMLAILGAHEFGHYAWCRRHNVDATLPYFLPAPLPFTGTLGAVIRIKEAFPSKRALFDIGIAGPIAGFVMMVPFLIAGVMLSTVQPIPQASIYFGEPLLFKAVSRLYFGTIPPGHDIFLHQIGFAAWFGMLATALNLMPFGQLDGGHIAYAVFGRRASYVSVATLSAAVLLTLRSGSWVAMTVMMLAMAFFLGVRHPRIVDEDSPLDGRRKLLALVALIIFIICFIPIPIEVFVRS